MELVRIQEIKGEDKIFLEKFMDVVEKQFVDRINIFSPRNHIKVELVDDVSEDSVAIGFSNYHKISGDDVYTIGLKITNDDKSNVLSLMMPKSEPKKVEYFIVNPCRRTHHTTRLLTPDEVLAVANKEFMYLANEYIAQNLECSEIVDRFIYDTASYHFCLVPKQVTK